MNKLTSEDVSAPVSKIKFPNRLFKSLELAIKREGHGAGRVNIIGIGAITVLAFIAIVTGHGSYLQSVLTLIFYLFFCMGMIGFLDFQDSKGTPVLHGPTDFIDVEEADEPKLTQGVPETHPRPVRALPRPPSSTKGTSGAARAKRTKQKRTTKRKRR